MWRRITISDDASYVLNLCQNTQGHRFCVATEAGVSPPDMVFQTRPITGAVLRTLSTNGAGLHFKLATGQGFLFGAHGEWFTEQEHADRRERGWGAVRWVTGQPPKLPPK